MSNLLQAPYFNPQTCRPARPGEPAGTNLPVRPAAAPEPLARLLVPHDGRLLVVRLEELDWIESSGNYVRLHANKRGFLIREKISTLEERLDPRVFARIHRSTIVNLDRVKELRPWFAGDFLVVLKDGAELKLSRGYRAKLEEQMGSAG